MICFTLQLLKEGRYTAAWFLWLEKWLQNCETAGVIPTHAGFRRQVIGQARYPLGGGSGIDLIRQVGQGSGADGRLPVLCLLNCKKFTTCQYFGKAVQLHEVYPFLEMKNPL
jgi:hypothetical protein